MYCVTSFPFLHCIEGIYHLDVYEPSFKFRKYKIDVSSKKGGTFRALSKPFPGGEKRVEKYPLVIEAIAPEVYFRQRSGSNPIAMVLRNPIFLIMGVFLLMKMFAPSMEEQKPADATDDNNTVEVSGPGDNDEPPSLDEAKVRNRGRRGKHDRS